MLYCRHETEFQSTYRAHRTTHTPYNRLGWRKLESTGANFLTEFVRCLSREVDTTSTLGYLTKALHDPKTPRMPEAGSDRLYRPETGLALHLRNASSGGFCSSHVCLDRTVLTYSLLNNHCAGEISRTEVRLYCTDCTNCVRHWCTARSLMPNSWNNCSAADRVAREGPLVVCTSVRLGMEIVSWRQKKQDVSFSCSSWRIPHVACADTSCTTHCTVLCTACPAFFREQIRTRAEEGMRCTTVHVCMYCCCTADQKLNA